MTSHLQPNYLLDVITEIKLKVALNTITPRPQITCHTMLAYSENQCNDCKCDTK
jgi:hypothetical protein